MKFRNSSKFCVLVSFALITAMVFAVPSSVIASLPSGNEPGQGQYVVPGYLQIGDLIFIDLLDFDLSHSIFGWDHVAIYIGNNEFYDAIPGGVGIRSLTDFISWDIEFCYGQVIATEEQKLQAIDFVYEQIGKPYQLAVFDLDLEDLLNLDIIASLINRNKDASIGSAEWYCSELIWAAYLHCTPPIEIDQDGDGLDRPNWVWPSEISSDDNVEMYTYHEYNDYNLELFLDWLHDLILDYLEDEICCVAKDPEELMIGCE